MSVIARMRNHAPKRWLRGKCLQGSDNERMTLAEEAMLTVRTGSEEEGSHYGVSIHLVEIEDFRLPFIFF